MRYRLLFFVASAGLNEENETSLRKSLCLSDSELVIFRCVEIVMKVVGSYQPRSRHDWFFCFSFFQEKKRKSSSIKVQLPNDYKNI